MEPALRGCAKCLTCVTMTFDVCHMGSHVPDQAQWQGLLAWGLKELDSSPTGCAALTTSHL